MENVREVRCTNDEIFIVDESDYKKVASLKWCDNGGYPYRTTYPKIAVHVFLMGRAPAGYQWDHIDHNKKNNSRSNLRLATVSQNKANRKKPAGGKSSRFKGVCKRSDKFRAQIKINQKTIYLGLFVDEEDAARAYDTAAKEHFGEYAYTNFRD